MNPIELASEIEERYRRYLKTTFYFKDPNLRASFEEALNSGHLSKGPYIEATPVFKRGQTPQTLFQSLLGLRLDEGFLKAINGDRSLYQHQEQAIHAVANERNVIVATGTGSGKTESFLYPILLHLYKEFQSGKLCSGVRALILYPMNALANDQRERLGAICRRLKEENSPFRFTFGQYIGETPEDEDDSRRHARDHLAEREQKNYGTVENDLVVHGELVLRSEMRETPPHILLTNYSMLEYLLLRPDDSPLFDNGRARWWTFLVLDEAHQYRGSRGIEMAMLIRRLKQRLREGGRLETFRCIATSATLVGGESDRVAVAKFASDLFGEEFLKENVILGEAESVPETGLQKLSLDDYRILREALHEKTEESRRHFTDLATKLGVSLPSKESMPQTIGSLLQSDSRSSSLRRIIAAKPAEISKIADSVFNDLPEGQRVTALAELVELLLWAKDPASDSPLLSTRYHLFLRSLEGAFVSYRPQKRVLLEKRAQDQEGTAFEVALCRECGQHYFVGKIMNNSMVEAIRDPGHPDYGATFFRPIEDQEDAEEDGNNNGNQVFRLCIRCGEICRANKRLQCNHSESIFLEKQDEAEEREDQVPRCSSCGYKAPDPVHEVVHGTDGPHAVIATTLYQSLPEGRKKVLAFVDGRQEAAFFAWYLEKSYRDILSRNLLLKVVQRLSPHTKEDLTLKELVIGLRDIFRERKVFPPAIGELELRREAWLRLYREFLTDEPRISLEGVGLARWAVKWPDWFKVPQVLKSPPWLLTEEEAHNLLFILLDFMRAGRAVELQTEDAVSLGWSDLGLQAWQWRYRIGPPKNQKGVHSWDGKTGKGAWFVTKLLTRDGLTGKEAVEKAVETLRTIWETIRQCDERAPSSYDRLLIPADDARRLNPEWWGLRSITDNDVIFQCSTCGRFQMISIRGVCPRYRCPGTLKEICVKDLDPNHYRFLYEADMPGSLHVEEHTAQLDKEKAREFQREFREGKIHVLSCSTTFELGVDLGNLDTIFLRNVPPETFNYIQRVGRAGRRSEYPGFAITYCRRGPHDLYHFSEPQRMLSGRVRPPVLSLKNIKIITRHITATALSYFFRTFGERFETVEKLIKDMERPAGVSDCKAFLQEKKHELEDSLRAIVPPNVEVGLDNGTWIEEVSGKEHRFSQAEAEISSDYKAVKELEQEAAGKGEYDTAKWAKARAKTIIEEDVLSFLSRKAVIPKYGFPVDVVELDTQRAQQYKEAFEVSLQRDLSIAISEFAPTSKLVANKKVWTSYGLKKVAEKEWPRKIYKRCPKHNVFLQWQETESEPATPCGDNLIPSKYIIPIFGFATDREKPKPPTSRTARVFTTRPYFAGLLSSDPATVSMPVNSPLIAMKEVSPGWMVVLCEGRRGEGFYVCEGCGAGFRKREKNHRTPLGQNCKGTLEQVSLGHEFVTDVLQLQFIPGLVGMINAVWFAYSLAYALLEGTAEVLEIPSTDLSATVAHSGQYPVPPIILYDNVPGGAGLVARLEEEEMFRACLETAQKRINGNCGCGENTSCYGCLRSYRNQFAHQYLQRGPVMQYLKALLLKWT